MQNKAATDTLVTTRADGKNVVAVTEPDWNSINFDSPESADPDITDKNITVRNGTDYTIFTLGENILFSKDDNKIQEISEEKLKHIANVLNRRYKGSYIGIYGNTDSSGTTTHNKKL